MNLRRKDIVQGAGMQARHGGYNMEENFHVTKYAIIAW
jgi:hypothetical protein